MSLRQRDLFTFLFLHSSHSDTTSFYPLGGSTLPFHGPNEMTNAAAAKVFAVVMTTLCSLPKSIAPTAHAWEL